MYIECVHKKTLELQKIPEHLLPSSISCIFFHPDCTVGFGVSPNHALRLVGFTTGRELHPALKMYSIDCKYTDYVNCCQEKKCMFYLDKEFLQC